MLQHVDQRAARLAGFRQAHGLAPRIADGFVVVVHDQRHHDMAVQRHADAFPHHAVQRADHHAAIQIQPPGLDMVDHRRAGGGEVDHRAVRRQHALQAAFQRQPDMAAQVAMLAVHRHHEIGPHQVVNQLQVRAVGMARNVIQPAAVVHHLDALLGQGVHDGDDRLLVARDGLGREQEGVAFAHLDPQILAAGQLGRCRPAFALAAGDDQHQVLARDLAGILDRQGVRKVLQHAGFHRSLHHAPHGAAQQDHRSPGRHPGHGQRANPGDVRSEGGRHHHAGLAGHQLLDLGTQHRFRPAGMVGKHVGGIADQRAHARPRDFGPELGIEGLAHQRGLVQLEVAGVHHPSRRRVDHQRRGLGDRVRHRQEGQRERPDLLAMRPGRDGAHHVLGLVLLLHLAPRDRGGEGPGDDRRLQAAPQVPHRTDMVLVGMGDQDGLDPVGALFQPGDVGKDQVDARGRLHVGERDPQIDHDQPFAFGRPIAVDIAVHPDLARAAEGEIDQSVGGHAAENSVLYL